jgi:hypothetical protein
MMLTTVFLALMVTSQSDYNLLAQENVPAAKATVQTPNGAYADEKVGALADARAKVRAYSRGLAEAQAQVNALTQSIAQEKPPRARIQYEDETGTIRETAPVIYQEVPVIRSTPVIRTVPRFRTVMSDPVTYSTAPPVTYSTAPPVTYAAAPPVVTYSAAAPVTYVTGAPVLAAAPVTLGSGVTTYSERTRTGLFGRVRQNVRATSTGFGAPPVATFASTVFGAGGTVCVSGSCP